ncbi:MAG: hypothetical protein GQ546_13285 [Gammaproteobacteria bacterium]|nr:hypothetical protein [Gammaproteobacteria bacterium]
MIKWKADDSGQTPGLYPVNTINHRIQTNLEQYSTVKHAEQHKHDKDAEDES